MASATSRSVRSDPVRRRPGAFASSPGDDTSTIFEAFGEEDDGFGLALSAIGDVDGDGITDLIAGAPTRVIDDVEVGVAVVISGADGSALMELQGVEDGGQFGAAVAGLGD